MNERMVTAHVGSKEYIIPERWIAGFILAHENDDRPATYGDAVAWWAYQETLAEIERKSQ